jgi:hypothetical protein
MGREATCHCEWGEQAAVAKVVLEAQQLVVRGAIRRRASLSSLAGVEVEGERLLFSVDEERVALHLGSEASQRWARAIATPPPSLAAKLGISSETRLLVIGMVQDVALKRVVDEAGVASGRQVDHILACATDPAELELVLRRSRDYADKPPIWIVYPKGPKSGLSESMIRDTFRACGFIDVKVASISDKLTGLRFVKRS